MQRFIRSLLLSACFAVASVARADPAAFDLAGPTLRVSVTRGGQTLPIGQVPQLAEGDRIAVRADLPASQSAHYLLVAAFLRGSTNPPPDQWFFKSEPWKKRDRDGLKLTVPADAQQVLLFLAPETGGDFATLRNAVEGRPGAFVRSAQELAQASLDRSRLDAYLAAVRMIVPGDPGRLTRITPLLARSLQIKVNSDCLARMPSLQASCLLQNQESLVLSDGHSNAITDDVAGPGADLALQLSATPQGGLGYYSPYIAAIRDVIGILSSLHTARYQYIPALGTLDGDRMGLILNAAPSFHNPKSVLVAALPIVAPTHVPPLQIPETSPSLCMQASQPLLAMAGAPLIYATRYAHDLTLRATLPDGRVIDLRATPDVERGGLSIDTSQFPKNISGSVRATLHGWWGFQPFDGPSVALQSGSGGKWRTTSEGRPSAGAMIDLTGGNAACVRDVTSATADGQPVKLSWNRTASGDMGVKLPTKEGRPQRLTITVSGMDGAQQDIMLDVPKPPARLAASIVDRHIEPASAPPVAILLGSETEIPASATTTFSLRLDGSAKWTGKETVEVTVEHGGTPVELTVGNGLTIVDDRVAVARLQPERWPGESAYGALQARILGDGAVSSYLPLGTLVRLPRLGKLNCSSVAQGGCELSGEALYLIRDFAISPGFEKPIEVPPGFTGSTLTLPVPADGHFYLRLHDAPSVVNSLVG